MKTYVVYLIKYNGVVMYVGETGDYIHRKSQHRTKRGTGYSAIPIDIDLSNIKISKVKEFDNETDALKLEGELIIEYNTIESGWNHRRSGLVTKDSDYYEKYLKDKHVKYAVEWNRIWRENNRDEFNAKQRDYYHSGGGKDAQRRYHEKHRDEINARRREKRRLKKLNLW